MQPDPPEGAMSEGIHITATCEHAGDGFACTECIEQALNGQLAATLRVREDANKWFRAYQEEFSESTRLRSEVARLSEERDREKANAEDGYRRAIQVTRHVGEQEAEVARLRGALQAVSDYATAPYRLNQPWCYCLVCDAPAAQAWRDVAHAEDCPMPAVDAALAASDAGREGT
jgi:hypothetical protein